MATRIKEGMIPYTGGDGIEITDNHVINVLLRAANNLIHVNEDRELYVDLQLPAGIAPDDDFPVGVTTGEILAEDGWQQSGTIINSKTTSGDYVRLIYANDGNLYYDPGTGVWIMIGTATAIDVNTKTFFLSSSTDYNTMLEAAKWYLAGKNPIIMYQNQTYLLHSAFDAITEDSFIQFVFLDDVAIYTAQNGKWDESPTTITPREAGYISFQVRTTNGEPSGITDSLVTKIDTAMLYVTTSGNIAQTITGTKTFNTSPIVPSKSTSAGNNPTTIATEAQVYLKQDKLTAGSGIVIDSNTNTISANIQGALVYKGNVATTSNLPASGTVGDVYYVEADGLMYAWDGTTWKAVGNTQIDLSNYFNVTTNTTDDITQGTTNLFVTQAMIDAWNGKQGALTAGSNIQINNGVISATDTTYSAGTGITIDQNNQISNSLPFNPENAGTVGQVLKRTSTGARWGNEMSIQGTTFGSLMTACANNGREHVTYFSNESNVNTEWTENYTFQGLGWIRIKSFHGASGQASMRINGVTVLIEQTGSGPYTVKLGLGPFTMGPGDAVTFYTEQGGSAATLEAYVFDYY